MKKKMIDGLYLREISTTDLDYLWKLYSDKPTMTAFGRIVSTEKSELQEILDGNLTWPADRQGVRYLAFTKADEFVGEITLKRYNKWGHRAEIDYIVCPEFRKNGYGPAMIQLFLRKVFADWPLGRVSAYVDLDNSPSYRFLEKNGFVREGILRNWSYAGEKYHDCYSYSFIAEDLEET